MNRNRAALLAVASALALAFVTSCSDNIQDDRTSADAIASFRQGGNLADEADYIFDQSTIRTYELVINAPDWQWLNDNPLLEEYVPATLLFEGEEYPLAAARYKGFFGVLRLCFDAQGNLICDKLSMKLKFSEFDDSLRFFGLKRLNFHSMESDPTKMHDMLAYGLYRDAGVFASRTAYANLIVNGEPFGLFALVEQVDGMFSRSRFPDGGGGNIYKEVWPVHQEPQPYLQALRTNREEDPSADKMVRFAAALDGATDETFVSVLQSWTDVDMLVNYLAVDRLIDNWDGIVAWYCVGTCFNHNYYWYEDTSRDRLWLIPWDVDHTFEEPSPIRTAFGMPDWDVTPETCDPIPIFLGIQGQPPACDELIGRLSTLLWEPYSEATRDLLAGPFATEAINDRIDEIAQLIEPAIRNDPIGPSVSEWQASVEKLKLNITSMRSYIEGRIAP